MTMFGISFPGSGGAYGTFETLPSFGELGYGAHIFGSTFTSTPSANLFDASTAGVASLYGTTGTLGVSPTGASFTGVIASGVLTVSGYTTGAPIGIGSVVYDSNNVQKGVVSSLGTGTGGNGTYNLATGWVAVTSQTMASANNAVDLPGYSGLIYNGAAFTADITSGVMTVATFPNGGTGTPLAVGDTIRTAAGVVVGVIASLGTGTGGTGTYNLAAGWVTVASGTTLYRGTANAVGGFTSIAIVQGTAGGVVSDYVATAGASMAMVLNGGGSNMLSVVRGATTVNSGVAQRSDAATAWTMYVAQFTATTVQAMTWRTVGGLVQASATALPTSGAVGSTTNKLQIGRPYGTPNSTVMGVATYKGALSTTQINAVGAAFSAILADAGQTL
ncbi:MULTISPECIES: hypothetical protein [unclassified Novosphingobium]|uniref:hypothetical protein n=1 Tax=unclassified Novosphingobium TaxID=2644732 RepID=UPI000D3FFC87|nr:MULTISPECIES: hypothetical protein [unclassified Novosphingobium]PTR06464.1 hypothetical protein C8K11_12077 [Novosphingobium sp. GV055]PUA94883.1 hypothetical protein C8K12_12077 [Novosphingobium sp. GV061]PUB13808.1 hypothetical protein C8K14_12077 [Novosphingobium sp. GV079]PUB38506.1 hypothetical protein C8K10_12077 [Novosphingobium sp. GV027]